MTALVVSKNLPEYRARVLPFLVEHEAENNLLFGVMHGIAGGRYKEALLAYLEDDGRIVGVAVRTPPYNLILSVQPTSVAEALAGLLDPGLPGVSATEPVAGAFAGAWSARTGRAMQRHMRQRIYALRSVRMPRDITGRGREARPGDALLLTQWMDDFVKEALGPDDPAASGAADRVQWMLNDPESGFVVWETDGSIVSFAGFSGPTPHGVRVGPVYTPPGFRRRGFAAACVAELSARQLASGRAFCFLYTDLSNPTSNSVYRRIGYEAVCDAAMYRFASA